MIEIIILAFASPLLSGIITKIKNNLRFRKGPGIFQPYFNLIKFFSKEEVVSEHASWIFRIAPPVVFAAAFSALFLLPFGFTGDLIAILFLLSLGRFFLALGGLDPASAFGGMGSSREMFISSLTEPVAMLAVFAIYLDASNIMAVAALFLVALAETSRIPVDNQETHLELTMVHEAMFLEYSGRSLSLIEIAAYIKQLIFFLIIALLIFPGFNGFLFLAAKLLFLCVLVAVTEVSLAKMRLFRVTDFVSFAGLLAVAGIIWKIL
ncbi:hypothetical protein A2276_03525 [candidate division WOR-1 bacterium RIFOXYA12_FULL_43_27]|uniref:Formate hydrogenlyase n=1 Tax=candidate division WOR-1 bacterium RIFOXYC2_FULL_46_14 TaxID=1802587 RepID=A0A1F4U7C5_UNCSA|nr:MAG: hypothetical protein A2276_03525 [candidate division WOR-1 bacterium RIFOXYA12_FULL_43_27]OGC19231.1 MAG: hypothetical protein A2292_00810 [candidate division WOR-1 bacterium RIFOXYB2_FULL_46_45]OGC30220.1 MAG: hypothetical protein A2232_00810 [candidate division WOR-1 bacterium RIFOXYA2_FULL_46_56]OGC40821.1 MAG: hypothetical protein A2438_00810 [candidate division WOR-1 bacterium RIFOXYC2_FULL_46_14]